MVFSTILLCLFYFILLYVSERWWCTEYADEIHDVLRKRECERLVFEYKAPQMKWRTHILQFIVEVGHVRNLSRDTVHLAAYLMDIFIDNHIISLWRLYLVALTSIRIAAKIEETDFTLQSVEALNRFGNYIKGDYNTLESIMLKMFDWDINLPTTSTFGSYYGEFVVDEADFNNNDDGTYDNFEHFKESIKSEVIDLVDKSLFDISLQHDIAPSKLAAMCLAAVRFRRGIEPVWPISLIKLTHYTWDRIEPHFKKLFDIKLIPRDLLEAELEENIHQESTQIDFE